VGLSGNSYWAVSIAATKTAESSPSVGCWHGSRYLQAVPIAAYFAGEFAVCKLLM